MEYKWDVFVSYNRKDSARAKYVVEDLRRAGLSVWFDRDFVKGGDRIRDRINEGLRLSRLVIVIVSPASLRSQWVLNELDAAMVREISENRKVVVLMLVGRIPMGEIPKDLQGKHFFDCRYNFEKRYLEQRSKILCSTAEWAQYVDEGFEIIPFGPNVMQRIMKFGYQFEQNDLLRTLVDELASTVKDRSYWDELYGDDNSYDRFEAFLAQYGEFGLRQLIVFFIDHSGKVEWNYDVSKEMLEAFYNQVQYFFAVYGIAKEMIEKADMRQPPLVFYLKPNETFGFGFWPGANKSISPDGSVRLSWPDTM